MSSPSPGRHTSALRSEALSLSPHEPNQPYSLRHARTHTSRRVTANVARHVHSWSVLLPTHLLSAHRQKSVSQLTTAQYTHRVIQPYIESAVPAEFALHNAIQRVSAYVRTTVYQLHQF